MGHHKQRHIHDHSQGKTCHELVELLHVALANSGAFGLVVVEENKKMQ